MNILINNEDRWDAHVDLNLADQIIFKVDVYASEDNQRWTITDTHQFAIQTPGDMDENGHVIMTDEIIAKINEEFNNKIQEIKDGYNLG